MSEQHQASIEYKECFVAFIDILGFSAFVKQSTKKKNILPVLTRALNTMAEIPSGTKESRHQNANGEWTEKTWHIQTRAFSDNIVIFMPKEAGSITQILFMVRYLHDRMLELGFCVRGAVTVGNMYWNDAWSHPQAAHNTSESVEEICYHRGRQNFPVTLGSGLINAHKLESEYAVYPRILIGRKLYIYIKKEKLRCLPLGSYYSSEMLLADFIRKDADDRLWFLDVLHPKINRNDTERIVCKRKDGRFSITWHRDGNTYQKVMENVRLILEKNCKLKDKKIREKYEWLKTYRQSIIAENNHGG